MISSALKMGNVGGDQDRKVGEIVRKGIAIVMGMERYGRRHGVGCFKRR